MDEKSVTDTFKAALEKRGFYVKKFADKATKGIPDSFLCKDGKGMFIEIKYVEMKALPIQFTQKKIFGDKKVQLMTMYKLAQHFHARYVLIIKVNSEYYYYRILPHHAFDLVYKGIPISLNNVPRQMQSFINELELFL